jgi:CBS domain-containing protein
LNERIEGRAENMVLAHEIMERDVVSVAVDTKLPSLCNLFYQEGITGAPVVDEQGRVVGVVSIADLIRTLQEDHEALLEAPNYYRDTQSDVQPEWLADTEEFEDRLSHRLVSEIMTSDVVAVPPDAELSAVVGKILSHRVHRLLVLDQKREDDELVGIISLFDLVALLE